MKRYLSEEALNQYGQQGYIIVPDLIPIHRLKLYEDRFLEIITRDQNPSPPMKIMRDIMVVEKVVQPESIIEGVNKLVNFENDEILFKYTMESKLLGVVRELIGPDLFSIATNFFNKPPKVDGRHPLHQDLRYFSMRPAESIIGTWTSISNATRESGCLSVIPGSHKRSLAKHGSPNWKYINAGFYGIANKPEEDRIHLETKPGETVLFHPLLIHGSGKNQTDECRRALSSHYATASCQHPKKDWKIGNRIRKIS